MLNFLFLEYNINFKMNSKYKIFIILLINYYKVNPLPNLITDVNHIKTATSMISSTNYAREGTSITAFNNQYFTFFSTIEVAIPPLPTPPPPVGTSDMLYFHCELPNGTTCFNVRTNIQIDGSKNKSNISVSFGNGVYGLLYTGIGPTNVLNFSKITMFVNFTTYSSSYATINETVDLGYNGYVPKAIRLLGSRVVMLIQNSA